MARTAKKEPEMAFITDKTIVRHLQEQNQYLGERNAEMHNEILKLRMHLKEMMKIAKFEQFNSRSLPWKESLDRVIAAGEK